MEMINRKRLFYLLLSLIVVSCQDRPRPTAVERPDIEAMATVLAVPSPDLDYNQPVFLRV